MVYRVCGIIVWLALRRDVNRNIKEYDEQAKGRDTYGLKYPNARWN